MPFLFEVGWATSHFNDGTTLISISYKDRERGWKEGREEALWHAMGIGNIAASSIDYSPLPCFCVAKVIPRYIEGVCFASC